MFKRILFVLFMLFSVKAYAGMDDLLKFDYKIITVQDVHRALGDGADVNMQSNNGTTAFIVVQNNLV